MTVNFLPKHVTLRERNAVDILFRWQGSIYKVVIFEITSFVTIYLILSCIYRFGLSADHRIVFEHVCHYCERFSSLLPVIFILGSYITMIVNRWFEQFRALPFPDTIALNLTAFVHGSAIRPLMIRRTVIRYANLSLALCLRSISPVAKRRFPNEANLVESGLMTEEEFKVYQSYATSNFNCFYIPLIWAVDIIDKARAEGFIRQDPMANNLVEEIANFRETLNLLFLYNWVNPPLVYTQVTTISVYTYFIMSIMGRQFLNPMGGHPDHTVDLYIPIFAIIQMIIYVGWLKVAEVLINPFGDDDDDFDTAYLLERNLQLSYVLVDDMHHEHPELVRDQFWDAPPGQIELPYTADTRPQGSRRQSCAFAGSLANLAMRKSSMDFDVGLLFPTSRRSSTSSSVTQAAMSRKRRRSSVRSQQNRFSWMTQIQSTPASRLDLKNMLPRVPIADSEDDSDLDLIKWPAVSNVPRKSVSETDIKSINNP